MNGPKRKISEAYLAKLRDPRWQKKRLEIMQRDNWTCQFCCLSTKTLNVHHAYYEYGKDPWEYSDNALLTLCETCHAEETESRQEADTALTKTLRAQGYYSDQIRELASALRTSGWMNPADFSKWCWVATSREALQVVDSTYSNHIRAIVGKKEK